MAKAASIGSPEAQHGQAINQQNTAGDTHANVTNLIEMRQKINK